MTPSEIVPNLQQSDKTHPTRSSASSSHGQYRLKSSALCSLRLGAPTANTVTPSDARDHHRYLTSSSEHTRFLASTLFASAPRRSLRPFLPRSSPPQNLVILAFLLVPPRTIMTSRPHPITPDRNDQCGVESRNDCALEGLLTHLSFLARHMLQAITIFLSPSVSAINFSFTLLIATSFLLRFPCIFGTGDIDLGADNSGIPVGTSRSRSDVGENSGRFTTGECEGCFETNEGSRLIKRDIGGGFTCVGGRGPGRLHIECSSCFLVDGLRSSNAHAPGLGG